MKAPHLSFQHEGEDYLFYYLPDSEYMRDRLEQMLTTWGRGEAVRA